MIKNLIKKIKLEYKYSSSTDKLTYLIALIFLVTIACMYTMKVMF